LYDFNCLG